MLGTEMKFTPHPPPPPPIPPSLILTVSSFFPGNTTTYCHRCSILTACPPCRQAPPNMKCFKHSHVI